MATKVVNNAKRNQLSPCHVYKAKINENNQDISQTGEVKYLSILLDHGLNRRKYLSKVINWDSSPKY